ncbi:hypothetical protein KZZ52_20620 [Dactylosporangium sp. AC04546]|nr:hypothetical protein [Dactylosporangium sp. AC04546]WVK87694.1 hypothetical protein KZZ52_20620 [Dactylosporangium sp. AC04546]
MLAARLATVTGVRLPVAGLDDAAARGGGSRLAVEARRLRDAIA